MAATLALDYDLLVEKVGDFLGYGRDPDALTADQLADIESCLHDGLREFYAPPRLAGTGYAHEWTFLRPLRTIITTVSDIYEYDLPIEYAGFPEDTLTIRSTSGAYCPIQRVGESAIRKRRSIDGTSSSGPPEFIAVLPLSVVGTEQRFQIICWPTPDAAYTLEGRMLVNPLKLSKQNPHPYGGPQHSQTVLEACLAAAERMRGDMDGHHRTGFYERLAASIQVDKKQSRGAHLGRNGDPGCPEEGYFNGQQVIFRPGIATHNGTQY